jgi:L-rhamnose mutarotase
MKQYCLALDLVNDPALIQEYETYHKKIWPEIAKSIRDSGIINMRIYRVSNRLTMIIQSADDFSFEKKNELDKGNTKVQQWEQLMWKYQAAIPGSAPGEKWKLMDCIFDLDING